MEQNQQQEIPIKEGEILDVEIIGIGKTGDGIAKIDGFVIIIPHAKEGERLEVEVTRVLPRLAFAEIVQR